MNRRKFLSYVGVWMLVGFVLNSLFYGTDHSKEEQLKLIPEAKLNAPGCTNL